MNNGIKDQTVTMAHGAGGRQTSELIDNIFAAHFANPDLTADDAAVLNRQLGKWQCLPMDLSYHLHFSQEEISENCLFAEQSMIWRVWEQSHCI